jgi:hypothetical protein
MRVVLPPILDQRHMSGAFPLDTAEEVENFWRWAGEQRPFRRGSIVTSALYDASGDETLEAFVDGGRWVALCATEGCGGGVAAWPDHPRGCCLDCGVVYRVKFPPKRDRDRAAAALAARPWSRRAWRPDRGETVASLRAQNRANGVGETGSTEPVEMEV